MDARDPVARGSLDGVPFFAADVPGPFWASLVFRVGRADETAVTAGSTHLVEHLLMPASTYTTVECNGAVDAIYTTFWAGGEQDQVRRFLEEIGGRIRALPVERLDLERRILSAEESSLGWNSVRQALALRFGPVGHGLLGYGEIGLRRVTEDEAVRWTAERFTAGNAALWTTDPSFEVDLRLPPGEPRPAPYVRPIDYVEYPSVYRAGEPGSVLFSMVAERTYAFTLGLRILERRLRDRLRYELGYSYDVSVDYQPCTARESHAWVGADVGDHHLDDWCREALEIFDAMAAGGPTDDELEEERARMRREELDPSHLLGWLGWMAAQQLVGEPYQSRADSLREADEVTPGLVAGALAAARRTLLVVGSYDIPELPGFAEYPLSSPVALEGRRHRPFALRERRSRSLIASPEGLSIAWPDGPTITARYDSTVLCTREGAARTLLTDDGFFLHVDPEEWTKGKRIVAEIDEAIPRELVISDDTVRDVHAEAVVSLAATTFRRTWLISDELELLPHLLEESEILLLLARASRGWNLGLLALTDRRLHFLYGDGSKHSFAVERGPLPAQVEGDKTVKLFVEEEWITLTDVEPKGKAAELEQLLHTWRDPAS
jgi:hypothetical protein